MALHYHGVEASGGTLATIHNGFILLLRAINSGVATRQLSWPEPSVWDRHRPALVRLDETATKFHRASERLANAVSAESEHLTALIEGNWVIPKDYGTVDVALYLDLLLYYARLQADLVAAAIPAFYGDDWGKIPRTLRGQARQFSREPNRDPGYAAVLNKGLEWFFMLAGRDEQRGLRDEITHGFSSYLSGMWSRSGVGQDDGHLSHFVSLAGGNRILSDDVVRDLRSISLGYFRFLERTFVHFRNRMRTESGQTDFMMGEESTVWLNTQMDDPALWIFPLRETA